MLHLLKYQFLQTIRSRSIMFWALAFPLILGTLFYVSFGNAGLAGTGETDWEPVPVAIVTVESSSANAASFLTFLNETDQDMIDIHSYKTEKAAKKALRREEISGIYYVKSVPSLTIASNGINQSILSSLLDSYEKNADMIRDIATQHPEKNFGRPFIPERLPDTGERKVLRRTFLRSDTDLFSRTDRICLLKRSLLKHPFHGSASGELKCTRRTAQHHTDPQTFPDSRRSAGTGKYSFRQHSDPGALPYPGTSYQPWA